MSRHWICSRTLAGFQPVPFLELFCIFHKNTQTSSCLITSMIPGAYKSRFQSISYPPSFLPHFQNGQLFSIWLSHRSCSAQSFWTSPRTQCTFMKPDQWFFWLLSQFSPKCQKYHRWLCCWLLCEIYLFSRSYYNLHAQLGTYIVNLDKLLPLWCNLPQSSIQRLFSRLYSW